MQIRLKSFLFAVSVLFNVLFIGILVAAVASKSRTALLSFPAPQEGQVAGATFVIFPAASPLVFNPAEITLKPGQKAFIQYSLFADKKQKNMLVNALYDPNIVSVSQTGFGVEIAAIREGETLMQSITANGIIDIALVTVTE